MASALLIEDHEGVRRVIKLVLEHMGYDVRDEADGHAGMAALAEGGVGLLVTDLRLPGPGGLELAAAALADHPQTPVLIVSGNVDLEDEEAIAQLGAGLLRKPFTSTQLKEAVDAVCAS